MKTRLIFIRHGFSEYNKEGLFTGQADVALTEIGLKQAERAAEYVDAMQIDCIYASPLSRAYETGLAVARKKHLQIIVEPGLSEINGGDWHGKAYAEMKEIDSVQQKLWTEDMIHCQCPNGESVREFAARVYDTVTKIATEHEGKTVCIATHATPIRVITCYALGFDTEYIQHVPWTPNASINIIDYENGVFRFVERDITEHLVDLKTNLPYDV